jgi:hypothetical protein
MKIFKKQNNLKSKTGFAILFAVLLASFLITLGISIFSISLKEIQMITSERDAQVAYYVADSARECALYWEIKEGIFPACNDKDVSDCSLRYQVDPIKGEDVVVPTNQNPVSAQIRCNGVPVTLSFNKNSLTYSATTSNFFQASSTSSSTPIADLIISNVGTGNGTFATYITAYGHNTGIIGRRVERSVNTHQ